MKKLIHIIFLTFLFTSCLGSKKIFDKTTETKTTEKTETTEDSLLDKKTNLGIKDTVVINVPESDNKEVMAMFEVLMKQLNTSKSSGSNSYNSRYDAEQNQLIIEFMVAATENIKTATNKNSKSEKTFEKQIDEYIYKRITALPWWGYLILVWFLRSHIINIITLFIPGIGSHKIVKRILGKTENKE